MTQNTTETAHTKRTLFLDVSNCNDSGNGLKRLNKYKSGVHSDNLNSVYFLDGKFTIDTNIGLKLFNTELPEYLAHLNRVNSNQRIIRKLKNTEQHLEAFKTLLAGLSHCSRNKMSLAVSRDGALNTNKRYLIPMMDYLTTKGYCTMTKGSKGTYVALTTELTPTASMETLQKLHDLKLKVSKNATFLSIKSAKATGKKSVPLPTTYGGKRLVNTLNRPILSYLDCILSHRVTHNGMMLLPSHTRIFNNGSLNEYGGRLYGGCHLQLSGSIKPHHTALTQYRKDILIDDERTIEIDYKHIHPSLLYWQSGIELKDDPYLIDGLERSDVKLVFLVLMNISSKTELIKAIKFSSVQSNIDLYKDYINKRKEWALSKLSGIEQEQPSPPFGIWKKAAEDSIQGYNKVSEHLFVDGFSPDTNALELVNAILDKHQPIEHLLFTKTTGLQLQCLDSSIMMNVLSILSARNIPALPVHDSIVVRMRDLETGLRAMKDAYQDYTGLPAKVSVG